MKVHYISPYRADKNIGKAINDAVEQLCAPPRDCGDDWIVLTDHDTLFLLPDTKQHIEEILETTDYDILGCMTNRLRSKEQLYGGRFNEDDRIREHIKIAQTCWETAGRSVKPATGAVAAFMLCFRVSAWGRVMFNENTLGFDREFCWEAEKLGLKIGIMTGIYVFHSYRLWSADAKNYVSHLISSTGS